MYLEYISSDQHHSKELLYQKPVTREHRKHLLIHYHQS